MADPYGKFDAALEDIYSDFKALRRGGAGPETPIHPLAERGKEVSLLLHFAGDLGVIETRGFRTEWVEGNFARGDVELTDLDAVAAHPGVIQLEYGSGLQPKLDDSVIDIDARGAGKIWTVTTGGTFSGKRGTGVLIGVIDTGIDFRHPVFMKPGSTDTTRILRIWDLGLAPHDSIGSPDVSLLKSSFTYGVEYTDKLINDVLQKKKNAKKVKHRDCNGHGTHVASTAAGDGRVANSSGSSDEFEYVGVAPGAELIVVKLLYLHKEPKHNGAEIPEQQIFEDAITYIEEVAKAKLNNRPVVINVSLGWTTGPHDGLGARDLWLDTHYKTAKRRAFVAAAGNETGERQRGLIKIPASGQIDVPFHLFDDRTVKTDRSHCDVRSNTAKELDIEFWYPKIAPKTLTVSLKAPKATAFTAGPNLDAADVNGTYKKNKKFRMVHSTKATQRPPSTSVTRNVVRIKAFPKGKNYGEGAFTLRVKGPANTTIHAWAAQAWPPHGFRMGHKKGPLPAGMTTPDSTTIGYPGTSGGAITVAAYDDFFGTIADFSSQGPLADYSGLGPHIAKPDLAAPGVEIKAANSHGSLLGTLLQQTGRRYMDLQGTSMAAPHIAGVAALMFEKKPDLSPADIVQALENKARSPKTANTFGAGRVDAKGSRDAV